MQHKEESVMQDIREAVQYYARNKFEFVADLLCTIGLFGLLWILLWL